MDSLTTVRDMCEQIGKKPALVRSLCEEVVRLRWALSDLTALEGQKRRIIVETLNETETITAAAERLGVKRTTLNYWMHGMQIRQRGRWYE